MVRSLSKLLYLWLFMANVFRVSGEFDFLFFSRRECHRAANEECPIIKLGKPLKPDGYTLKQFCTLLSERQLRYPVSKLKVEFHTTTLSVIISVFTSNQNVINTGRQ